MQRRTTYLLLGSAILLCVAAATAFYLQQRSPPRIALLLPEADAIVFFNVAPLRAATHFDREPTNPAPAYRQFIEATGIQPERDLDQAAFALTRMPDPNGPNGPVAFSEVFSGHFDTPRLTRYLAAQANSQEVYATHPVYLLPTDGRTLRITLLDGHTLAASNAPTPEQLHAIIDRSRTTLPLLNAASLLADLYPDVPALAPAWAIGHLALPFATDGRLAIAGLQLPIPANSTFIASLRFTTALHLRIDQLAVSQSDADQTTQALNNLLSLGRSLEKDPHPLPLLDSITIEAHKDRATLNATLPTDLLHHLTQATAKTP